MVSRAVMSWEVAMPIDSERGLGRDPDEILRQIKEAEESDERSLGKLKIFFGYAAGVGKTYAMLEEAQDLKRKGIDVVAGYIEPHARAETAAMAEGLEAVETRAVEHKGIDLRELDTDAVLYRRPQVVLVDELAHTNAPGSRHRKRYRDIEELLHAGINVLTTVNVQHLEGLNDKIASISHITVAERVPDYVFDQADMVELIDIEPDDLIERLQAGKIYLPERSRTALSNFFSRTNLGALREIALRRMADRMARRSVVDPSSRTDAGEDVLVLLTSSPDNAKAVRAAANMAGAYHGHLTAVMVEASRSSRQDAATRHRLRENLELAEELGGEVVTLQGDDPAVLVSQYAASAGITQLVVEGEADDRPKPWRRSLADRLSRLSYGASVTVVPVRTGVQNRSSLPIPAFGWSGKDLFYAAVSISVATALGLITYEIGLSSSIVLMLYMLFSIVFALKAESFWYAALVSFGSMLAYNYCFTVPRFTFNAYGITYPVIFVVLTVSTLLVSSLMIRMKKQGLTMVRRAYRTEVLLDSSRKLQSAKNVDECFGCTAEQIMKIFDRPVVFYEASPDATLGKPTVFDVPGSGGGDTSSSGLVAPREQAVAAWVAANSHRAGATTDTLADVRCLYLPARGRERVFAVAGLVVEQGGEELEPFEKNLLLMVVDECGHALERLALSIRERDMELRMEKETLRANLLRTISHDLRTPLTSISGDADILLADGERMDVDRRRSMYRDIREESQWLVGLVENLLSITRIEDRGVEISQEPELVEDVISEALAHIDRRAEDHDVRVDVSPEMLMARMDSRLIVQVVLNLVNNAVLHTPSGTRIDVFARRVERPCGTMVRISVRDRGPGIPTEEKAHAFDMFYNGSGQGVSGDHRRGIGIGLSICKSIIEAHGSVLELGDVRPHGCDFSFELPEAKAAGFLEESE